MSKIGFIGTGIMGRHMAKHLQDGGHDLLFCPHRNPTPDELLAAGGRDCASRRELTEQADVIIMVVPDTPQVAGVLNGDDGVIAGLSQGKLVIDMSSISPIETKQFAAKVMTKGCHYLDAPVSGGEVGAKAGTLTIMVGGPKKAFERALPDGRIFINPTGNAGMATGGMGDVLTGVIAGLIVQGLSPEAACHSGVYLHGAAADSLAGYMGPYGYLASDVMTALPGEIKKLLDLA